MAFAEDYKAEITLAYYCFNIFLTIAFFIFGTIYLWYKNRRDQQRRELRDRTDQQRREWRQFAERIYSEYSQLKAAGIPRKILKVRDTFQKIRMKSTITGLDVLRYMLADANRSKTTQLKSLREDLLSIFPLFNVCSSLILLGDIPENIKEELTDVVTELGNIALPFFKGKQREIILKCLEHFGNNRPKPETERRVRDLDARLEATVPYITSCLRFASHDDRTLKQLYGRDSTKCSDYSKCSDFSLDLAVIRQGSNQANLQFLEHLHADLIDPSYLAKFARELREHPVPLIFEQLNDDDEDELVLMKVLHEVRFYIHLYLNENQLVKHRKQIEKNMKQLGDVKKEVTKFRPTEAQVKDICERFIGDLQRLSASRNHCNSHNFCEELRNLWMKLHEIQVNIIRTNVDPSLPSTSQTANQVQENVA